MTCATAAPAQHRYGILQQLSPPRRGCRMQAGAHWPEALFSFSKAACGTSNPYSSSFASEQLGPALARPTSQPPARVHTCSHIRRYDRMHCESPSWSLFWGQADGNGILPRLVVGHSSASASCQKRHKCTAPATLCWRLQAFCALGNALSKSQISSLHAQGDKNGEKETPRKCTTSR